LNESIWKKLVEIPKQYIYAAALSMALLSTLIPIPMTRPVPDHIWTIYNYIEALPEGAVCILTADTNAGYFARLYGGQVALARHLVRKHAKIYFVGLGYEDGPLILQKVIEWIEPDLIANNYVYGEDYVHLGYVSGFESAYASFCRDVKKTISTDYYGTPIEEIPMMEYLNSAADVQCFVQTGSPLWMPAIRQYSIPFDKGGTLIPVLWEGQLGMWTPYVEAGQMLQGLEGALDGYTYEQLMEAPFIATYQYVGSNLLMFLAIIVILSGNIVYWIGKSKGEVEP